MGELFMAREQDILDMQSKTTVSASSGPSEGGGGGPYAGIKVFRQVYLGYRFGKTSNNFARRLAINFRLVTTQ